MHNHVSRGQTLQKIISPPPLNAEKVRKWVFGPIRMKGERVSQCLSTYLSQYQHAQAPNLFGLATKGKCLYI